MKAGTGKGKSGLKKPSAVKRFEGEVNRCGV
jgi:hypothetical protein